MSPKSGYSDDAQEKHDSHIRKFFCLEIISCSLSCFSLLGAGVIKLLSPFSPENTIYYIIFSINKALIKEAKETLKLANRELNRK